MTVGRVDRRRHSSGTRSCARAYAPRFRIASPDGDSGNRAQGGTHCGNKGRCWGLFGDIGVMPDVVVGASQGLWNQLVGESPAPGTPARSFVQLERVLHQVRRQNRCPSLVLIGICEPFKVGLKTRIHALPQVEDEVQRELAGLESKLRSVHADQLLAQCAMERKLLRTEATKSTAVPISLDLGVTDTIPEVPEDEQAPSPSEVFTPSRSSGCADRLANRCSPHLATGSASGRCNPVFEDEQGKRLLFFPGRGTQNRSYCVLNCSLLAVGTASSRCC